MASSDQIALGIGVRLGLRHLCRFVPETWADVGTGSLTSAAWWATHGAQWSHGADSDRWPECRVLGDIAEIGEEAPF